MITALFLTICFLALIVMVSLTGFLLKIFGKFLGILLSVAGYMLIGMLIIGAIGLGIVVIPVVFIVGLISIISSI